MVFFGLKDRYIYWALGALVAGLVFSVVLSLFLDLIGLVLGLLIAGSLLVLVFKWQEKKGLYPRPKDLMTIYVTRRKK